MNIHRKYKNLFTAFAILMGYVSLLIVLFFPGNTGLGNFFNLSVLLIVTCYVAVIAGVILLLLRLFKWLKDKFSLVYILVSVFNLSLALGGFILYYIDKADLNWVHNSIGNLFIGFLIFADTFIAFPAKE